jgi:hypothetical protein
MECAREVSWVLCSATASFPRFLPFMATVPNNDLMIPGIERTNSTDNYSSRA